MCSSLSKPKPLGCKIVEYLNDKVEFSDLETFISTEAKEKNVDSEILKSLYHALQHYEIDFNSESIDQDSRLVMKNKMYLISQILMGESERDLDSAIVDFFKNPYT